MCNRFRSPDPATLARHARGAFVLSYAPGLVRPRDAAPFLRARAGGHEARLGRWQIVPPHARTIDWPYQTHATRWEKAGSHQSMRHAWDLDRRCVVPAQAFYESNYETGINTWWMFRRADGALCGLAGLWDAWDDPATGAWHETFTVLTQSADACPLMRRMHKTDPRHRAQDQDKRSVIVLEPRDWEAWMHGSKADAASLVRLSPVETFVAGPARWLDDGEP